MELGRSGWVWGYILKVEPSEFANRSDVGCWRKRNEGKQGHHVA